jgi:hypothetical protein
VLRFGNRKVIKTCDFENAMELFLTKFPNGEIRSSKRRLDGYMPTHPRKKHTPRDKRKGLDLNLSSSEADSDSSQGNNKIRVQPGEDLDHGYGEVEVSSDDCSSSDNDLDY